MEGFPRLREIDMVLHFKLYADCLHVHASLFYILLQVLAAFNETRP